MIKDMKRNEINGMFEFIYKGFKIIFNSSYSIKNPDISIKGNSVIYGTFISVENAIIHIDNYLIPRLENKR